MKLLAKKIARNAFKKLGISVKRVPVGKSAKVEKPLPPLFQDPMEALVYQQSGDDYPASFQCPLDQTITLNGLSYSPNKWHPFVATLQDYANGSVTTYEGSALEAYYKAHCPDNAAGGIVGFDHVPAVFKELPSHVYSLAPWWAGTAEEIDRNVRLYTMNESFEHGSEKLTLESDGYLYHGPVSIKKGRFEYQRLTRIYETLKTKGYDRTYGSTRFLLLRRGAEYRYLSAGNGNHRTAAMTALGYKTVPAVFRRPIVIDSDMASYWPQVRRGVWTRKQALAYFNHLFDFDSRSWAGEQRLLDHQKTY